MDKASDYESGDSRFESWRGRLYFDYYSSRKNEIYYFQKKNRMTSRSLTNVLKNMFFFLVWKNFPLKTVVAFWICLPFLLVL